jgi:hypothetical protein
MDDAQHNGSTPPCLPPGLKRHYEIFRDYIKHEDDLINQRSTWHLLIQGFLFATLGVLGQWQFHNDSPDQWYMERHRLVIVISLMGMLIAAFAERSILAANWAATKVRSSWDEQVRNNYGTSWMLLPDLAGGGDARAIQGGRLSAMTIPVVVGAAWLLIFAMVAWDYALPSHVASKPPQPQPTHLCGQPIISDIAPLTKQQLVQELACSQENTDMLRAQLAKAGLQLIIQPIPSPPNKHNKQSPSKAASRPQ